MTAASSKKEFFISDRKVSRNEISHNCKINSVFSDKSSEVLPNTVSEYSKVEVASKNHLSPQRNKEIEHCISKCRLIVVNVMQNKKSPQKSDKLQNKKTENFDKLFCEKK